MLDGGQGERVRSSVLRLPESATVVNLSCLFTLTTAKLNSRMQCKGGRAVQVEKPALETCRVALETMGMLKVNDKITFVKLKNCRIKLQIAGTTIEIKPKSEFKSN